MKEINYIIGDATNPPVTKGAYSVICHCCNTMGAWGAGFVIPLGNRYPSAKKEYIKFIQKTPLAQRLGNVSYVKVTRNIVVANIMGQSRIYRDSEGNIPLNYEALKKGLENVLERFNKYNVPYTIHMPRIGCGLAGGDWNIVENIVKEVFSANDVEVYVYDLEK